MWGGDGWAVVGQICGVWGQEWGAGGQNRRLEPWVKGGLGHSSGRGSSGGGDTGGAGGGVSTFGLGSLPPIAAIPFAAAPQRHRENCPPFPPLPPIPCLPFPTPVAPPFSPPHGHFLGCVRTASCSGMRRGGSWVGDTGGGRDGTGRDGHPRAPHPHRVPAFPCCPPPPLRSPPRRRPTPSRRNRSGRGRDAAPSVGTPWAPRGSSAEVKQRPAPRPRCPSVPVSLQPRRLRVTQVLSLFPSPRSHVCRSPTSPCPQTPVSPHPHVPVSRCPTPPRPHILPPRCRPPAPSLGAAEVTPRCPRCVPTVCKIVSHKRCEAKVRAGEGGDLGGGTTRGGPRGDI